MKSFIICAISCLVMGCSDTDTGSREVSQYHSHKVDGNVMTLREYIGKNVTPMQLEVIREDGWKCVGVFYGNTLSDDDTFVFERVKK